MCMASRYIIRRPGRVNTGPAPAAPVIMGAMSRHAPLMIVFLALAAAGAALAARAPMPSVVQAREFRLKMVASYGPATWDDLVLARQCLRCGTVVGRQTILPGQARPRNPADWVARIQEIAGRAILHRRCPTCGATPAGSGFRTLLFSGMVFMEGGGDLELMMEMTPPQKTAVVLALAKIDGSVTNIPWPVTGAKFTELSGATLSVRQTWNDLINAHAEGGHPAFTRVEDGYYLVFAPAAETDEARDRLQKETVALLDNLTKQAGAMHVEALRDLEEQNRPIRRDTYHDWLAEPLAKAVHDGDVTALAAISPKTFFKLLAREADALGVTVRAVPGKDTEVQLVKGPIHLTIPISGQLIRTVHQGLSFEQGLLPLLEEVNRARAMDRLHRRITSLVDARFQTEIVDGQRLRFVPRKVGDTSPAPELDLAALAGKVDLPENAKAGEERLASLIGLDVKTGGFRAGPAGTGLCQCGKPTTPGMKVRPLSLTSTVQELLAKKQDGVLIAAVLECPDHINYVKPGKPYADFDTAWKAFEGAVPSMQFPIRGVGLVAYRGASLPYAVGQDLPTVALDAGLAAGLLKTLQEHFAGRAASPPVAHLPGPGKALALFAPFEHTVVLSPVPIPPNDQPEVARLVHDALEGPFSHVDPGPDLGFARQVTLDAPPRGRFDRRTP